MATKLTKKQTKVILAEAKKLQARDKAAAAQQAKKLRLPKGFKPTVPARTPPKDTSRRPSSQAFSSNKAKIESLVPPERGPMRNISTLSYNAAERAAAYKREADATSRAFRIVDGKEVPLSDAEWKKAAQKFVNAERKIPKGTSLSQVKAVKLAGKEKQAAEVVDRIVKAKSKGLDVLSKAELKMAREGIAPPRAPATPPTAAPAPTKPAVKKVAAAPKAAAPAKMTRAQRSAANKAKHAVVRAAEEKKWAEQKAAKKGAVAKPAVAKPAAAKPAKPVASKPAKPVVSKPTATAKPKPAAKPKPTVAKPAPAATAKPAPAAPAAAAPAAPKTGIMGRVKGAIKNAFSLKGIGVGVGGSIAADAIRGDGNSAKRNVAATVVGDAATGYAIARQYGALIGAGVGLVRSSYEEGKRTGRAPFALPETPRMGGTFGGRKPAATTQTVIKSAGSKVRGGVPFSRTSAPAPARSAATAKQGVSGFGAAFSQARQARLAGKAGDTFQYGGKTYTSYQRGEQPRATVPKAAPVEMPKSAARTAWSTGKGTDAGGITITAKSAESTALERQINTMQTEAMTARQLEQKFKKVKGPR